MIVGAAVVSLYSVVVIVCNKIWYFHSSRLCTAGVALEGTGLHKFDVLCHRMDLSLISP